MSSLPSMQYISFEKFLEVTEEKLHQKASSVIYPQKQDTDTAETAESKTELSLYAEKQDEPLVFDDFSFDDDISSSADHSEEKTLNSANTCVAEQDLIEDLSSLLGKTADLWMAETSNELLFAISLLYNSPNDNFLPRIEENNAAVAFLFYSGELSNPPMVAVLDGIHSSVRACKNLSWEEEIYSKKHEKKILLLPSNKINKGKLVLICRFRSDITSIDETQLSIFQSHIDFLAGRQVLFVSSDPSAMLSLKENKWWDHFVETGRFHIVLCNIRNISVGEFDSSSPVEGALKNFKKQGESFYPGAWRHAIL